MWIEIWTTLWLFIARYVVLDGELLLAVSMYDLRPNVTKIFTSNNGRILKKYFFIIFLCLWVHYRNYNFWCTFLLILSPWGWPSVWRKHVPSHRVIELISVCFCANCCWLLLLYIYKTHLLIKLLALTC